VSRQIVERDSALVAETRLDVLTSSRIPRHTKTNVVTALLRRLLLPI